MITSVAVLTSEPEHFQQHDERRARAFIFVVCQHTE
jgi:hypothetical protein